MKSRRRAVWHVGSAESPNGACNLPGAAEAAERIAARVREQLDKLDVVRYVDVMDDTYVVIMKDETVYGPFTGRKALNFMLVFGGRVLKLNAPETVET